MYTIKYNPTGTKAYGGPTLPLFVASWNLRQGATETYTAKTDQYGYTTVFSADGIPYATSTMLAPNGTSNYTEKLKAIGSSGNTATGTYSNKKVYIRPIVTVPKDKIKLNSTGTMLEVIMNK